MPLPGWLAKGLGIIENTMPCCFGQRLRGQLEQHQVVGTGQRLVEAEVQLVLAVRVLVVDLQHVQPAASSSADCSSCRKPCWRGSDFRS